MNEIAVAVPFWPETKASFKPRRTRTIIPHYLYPALFFIYLIALWALFVLYRLILDLTLKLYVLIKRMEKQKLKRRLVIVGGGYAGTFAAKQLEHDFSLL